MRINDIFEEEQHGHPSEEVTLLGMEIDGKVITENTLMKRGKVIFGAVIIN